MNYVMSDIHGDYERYVKMLEKIGLEETDELYILGDVIDRGKGGIRILKDMMMRSNVFPVLGNHEYMMMYCVRFLLQEITEKSVKNIDGNFLQGLTEWMNVGGSVTMEEFYRLNGEEREDIVDYLSEFALWEQVETAGKTFVLVHAGLANFDAKRSLESYDVSELIFKPPCYEQVYFKNKYLVTGHFPTRAIRARHGGGMREAEAGGNECRDEIYRENNHIAIDCGCGYDGKLGCICLENLREYYV